MKNEVIFITILRSLGRMEENLKVLGCENLKIITQEKNQMMMSTWDADIFMINYISKHSNHIKNFNHTTTKVLSSSSTNIIMTG